METKMIQVPFDIELAKKITSGDILGKVVTRDGKNTRIVCFDKKNPDYPIVGLVIRENIEVSASFTSEGIYSKGCSGKNDLMLEIPEYLTYKDGDIIYGEVDNGGGDYCKWLSIVKEIDCVCGQPYVISYVEYNLDSAYNCGCLEYGKSANNFDIIRPATEEEEAKFAERLKVSKSPIDKEYLEKFFGIKYSPKVSNSVQFGPKEELLKEAVHQHYQCDGKYPCEERAYCRFCEGKNIAHDCDEDCCADEFAEGFEVGWNACLEHLASMPWDEAMNVIVNYCKGKED